MPGKRKQTLPNGRQADFAREGLSGRVAVRQSNGGAQDPPASAGNGHRSHVGTPPTDLTATVAEIRSFHRQRCFAMEQRKRLDLALGAFLRIMLGWSRDLPEADRKKIATRASKLIKAGNDSEWSHVIAAAAAGRKPFAEIEKCAVKEMERLAETLPAWVTFGEAVRGFGAASLAVIVAEAGDLSNYANPGKLWKRMGLAVMGDVRQGGLAKNASKESWIAHGYNRQRRSRMWNIGDALIKGNKTGEYRRVYLERKKYELARDPEMKPIKAHRRAQRYMEKRLLKNLWQAWRRAALALTSKHAMPAADLQRQTSVGLKSIQPMSVERSAFVEVNTSSPLPSAAIPAKAGKRRATVEMTPSRLLPAANSSAQAEHPAVPALPPIAAMRDAIP